jgi:hypothetical protein
MSNLLPLVLLYLLSKKGTGGPRRAPGPGVPTDPFHFPKSAAPVVPSALNTAYGGAAQKWVPYKPLTAAVIQRAEQILHTANAPFETIEADPDGSGHKVRFIRTKDAHTGHTNVTAWMPSATSSASVPMPHRVTS